MSFQKAERFLTNPTIAITGPTGSGKTFSALRVASGIAKAMGKRFAVIDTENGSASLYSEFFDFDTMNLTPPFTTEKYIEAINAAEKGGYCALVIDSLTHAWAGEGGLVEQKAQLDARPNSNHWQNWNPIKAKDSKLRSAYLHSNIPFIIATMRSKMEYMQTENAGKKKIEKAGMAPIQSVDVEYEFSIVLDVAMNNECEVSKDRTHLFEKRKIFKITEADGEMLSLWRSGGKSKPVAPTPEPKSPAEPYQEFPPDDFTGERTLDDFLGPAGVQSKHPPGSVEAAALFVVGFGQHNGKMIKDIPESVLRDYCNYLQDTAAKDKKNIDPKGKVGLLLENAAIYLGVE